MAEDRLPDQDADAQTGMTQDECRRALDELDRYRLLAKHARDIIIVLLTDGRIVEANDAALDAYGYSRDELLSLTIFDLRVEETWPDVAGQIERVQQGGLLFETIHRRKDGSTFPVEINSTGAVIGGERVLVSIIRDITGRKHAEDALRESEARFREAVEGLLDPFVIGMPIYDESSRVVDFRVDYANDPALEFLVTTRDEFVGGRLLKVLPLLRSLGLFDLFARVARTGEPIAMDAMPFEYTARGERPGHTIDIRISRVPGDRVVASWRDVEKRVHAERALEAERARLQTVLSTLPVGVSIADASGRIVEANEAVRRVWGGPVPMCEGISGYGAYKGWWADTGKRVEAEDWALARAVTSGEVSVGEVIDIERFDGTRGTILNSAAPIRDDRGNIVGAVVAVQDITDLRMAEQSLLEAEHDLNRAQAVAKTGSWRLDIRHNELFWSDEAYRIFGVAKGTALTYETFVSFVHPEDRDYVDAKWAASLLGEPYDIEHRICVGGAVKWVRETAELEFNDCGELAGGFGTVRDITDRKLIEQQLTEALERETYFSRQLQGALVPPEVQPIAGYKVAHAFVSPFAGREIGGDFYDVFTTESGCIGMVMGDVSGKGLEAASVAVNTRATVRAFAYDMSDAGQALTHTNDVICAQQPAADSRFFVTMFLAILVPETGKMDYASAGHPPPAIYHAATGDVEFPTFGNPPIGVVTRYEYGESTARLEPGDRIVLYTDGLSEARDGEEMFETEGIERVIKANASRRPDDLIEALLSAASQWANGHLRDDTAILVVTRE